MMLLPVFSFCSLMFLKISFSLPSECPHGWKLVNGICIYFAKVNHFLPWGLSQAYCADLHPKAQLLIIKEEEYWNFIVQELNSTKGSWSSNVIHIGGYYSNEQSMWFWTDLSEVEFLYFEWQKGQPNGTELSPELCLGVDLTKPYGISDMPCGIAAQFACQLDLTSLEYKATNNNESREMLMSEDENNTTFRDVDTWTKAGHAYYVVAYNQILETHADGLVHCQQLDQRASLPEFHNSADYKDFLFLLSQQSKMDHLPIILGLRGNGKRFVNANGSLYYTNWGLDEPYDQQGHPSCVFTKDIYGYKWYIEECSTQGVVVCQIDTRYVMGESPLRLAEKDVENSLSNKRQINLYTIVFILIFYVTTFF